MPNNFFLTGLPQSGKTTLLGKLASDLKAKGYRVGGFISPEIKKQGTRKGFYVQDLANGKRASLAEVSGGGGSRVGKYRVNVKSFESIAMPSMEDCDEYDLIIIDEIGKMELESKKFSDTLADLLQTPMPIVASLHNQYLHIYEIYGSVYHLTGANHEAIYIELLDHLVSTLKKKPMAKLKFENMGKTETRSKNAQAEKPEQQKDRTERIFDYLEAKEKEGLLGKIKRFFSG